MRVAVKVSKRERHIVNGALVLVQDTSSRLRRFVTLSSITVILLLIISSPTTFAAGTFHYHGVVTEIDGISIEGARIDVYDETSLTSITDSGLHIKTIYTSHDGSFSFDAETGRYRLEFSKPGYIIETRQYSQAYTLDVDLGSITIGRNVEFTVDSTSIVAQPGTRRTTSLHLTNHGSAVEEVTLTTEEPSGWAARIVDSDGEVIAVTLPSGSTRTLSLVVDIPVDASSGVVEVTAQGHVATHASMNVTIQGEQPSMLSCEYPSKQRATGGLVDYAITVTNPSPTPETLSLTLGGLPTDWGQTILNKAGERIYSIHLSGGASEEVTLHVEIPADAEVGAYQPYVEVNLGEGVSRLQLSLAVEHEELKLGMVTMYPEQLIEQGKEASFPLILENPGEVDEVVVLSTRYLPDRWRGSYANGVGAIIQSVLLQAGSRQTVTLVLTPPFDAAPNNYRILSLATSLSLRGNLTLTVGIVGKTDMKVSMGNLFGQVTVGEERNFEVRVKNTGFAPITYPRIEADPSVSSLSVVTGPLDVKTIQPGEDMAFFVRVTPLEGTAQGDYLVDVKAVSREMQSEALQIRLTVQASSSQTLTVVIVIAAAFALVFLVYRKFKRK